MTGEWDELALTEHRARHPSTDVRARRCSLSRWDGTEGLCRWCNGNLTGRRTVWCSAACTNEFTQNHSWGWARKAALKRDARTCQECGQQGGWLEVHHLTPILGRHGEFSCIHHQDGLTTLCGTCHLTEHQKLKAKAASQDAPPRLPSFG